MRPPIFLVTMLDVKNGKKNSEIVILPTKVVKNVHFFQNMAKLCDIRHCQV